MKSGKSPFDDAGVLGDKTKSFGSVERIVASIAKSLQEVFAKLPPLNILMVGTSSEECMEQLRLLFGPRYFDQDHKHDYAPGITQYKAKKHPLCIYQTEIHSSDAVELSDCLKLMRTCEEKSETALDLLIFCAENLSGQLTEWEQKIIVRLSMEVDISLLVMLKEGSSAEAAQQAKSYLDESLETQYRVVIGTKNFCTDIFELLQPEQPKRDPIRTVAHAAKSKIWPGATVQDTFVHLERIDYALKVKPIHAIINRTSGAAWKKAMIPVGSDAVVMVPLEAIMMAGITSYFEVKVSDRLIKTLMPAVLSTSAATFTGKFVAGKLQFIPNVFTKVSVSAVNAVTATVIVQTIGRSYYLLLLAIEKNEISEDELGSEAAVEKLKHILKTVSENAQPQINLPFRKKSAT